jgi:hypothetical protein
MGYSGRIRQRGTHSRRTIRVGGLWQTVRKRGMRGLQTAGAAAGSESFQHRPGRRLTHYSKDYALLSGSRVYAGRLARKV